jgi:hypothetical protein
MQSCHDYTYISAFEYAIAHPHLVALAGRALQQYPYPKQPSFQPSLDCITPEMSGKLTDLMRHLFHLHESYFQPDGKLWKFACCLLATFIMHFESFSTRFYNHLLMAKIRSTLARCDLTCEMLRSLSANIREEFFLKNRRIILESTPHYELKIEKLENLVAEQKLELNEVKRKLDVQTQLLHRVLDILVHPDPPRQPHSSRKRNRVGNSDTPEDLVRAVQVGSILPDSSTTALDPTAPDTIPEFDDSEIYFERE